MRIWNYLFEFFLFRKLFGSHKQSDPKPTSDTAFRHIDDEVDDDMDINYGNRHNSRYSYLDDDYDSHSSSYDYFHEEQDDYDMMDDF